MKVKVKRLKERNPFHDHPLMKKGGVHEKPEKTKRQVAKQQLKKGEWYDQSIINMYFVHAIH